MERYKILSRQWSITKLLITGVVLISAILLCVIGFMRDRLMEVVAAEIALFVVWFLLDRILDMLRPMPPIMMIPIPQENEDESTKN